MTIAPRPWLPPVARADGSAFASAAEVVIKGLLECESTLSALFLPRGRFAREAQSAIAHDVARAALELNRFRLEDSVDASRGLVLLAEERAAGRNAAAFVPNASLNAAFAALRSLASTEASTAGARTLLLLEDDSTGNPHTCPRRVARRLRLPMLEPATLQRVPGAIDAALSLSMASSRPCGLILHRGLLSASTTLGVTANRLVAPQDQAAWLMARTTARAREGGDALSLVRRLELNRATALPSPGQREQIGLMAIGVSGEAVSEMLEAVGLSGRMPVLHLECLSPLDEAFVQRFLERCEHAIVLEPRPGSVAPRIVGIAQRARREARFAGQVWWDELPPLVAQEAALLAQAVRFSSAQTTRGSLLARALEPWLVAVRGGTGLSLELQATPAWVEGQALAPRGEAFSPDGVRSELEKLLRSITVVHDDGTRVATLGFSIAGRATDGITDPIPAEMLTADEFLARALPMCQQVAAVGGPRLIIVIDLPSDPDRSAGAVARAIAETLGGVAVVEADLKDEELVRTVAAEALRSERPTIALLREGSPARRDPTALRQMAAEVDRLGHAPLERLVWPAETILTVRPDTWERAIAQGLEQGEDALSREARMVRVRDDPGDRMIRVIPVAEQIEVRRSRTPSAYARSVGRRFSPPTPLHAAQSVWRVHLAGTRGDAPGVAARLLAEAGRGQGYAVDCLHDDTVIGPGREGWTQLVFSAARPDDPHAVRSGMSPAIPFGEADLFVGLEPEESLRGLGLDPTLRVVNPRSTCVVVNSGWIADQRDRPEATTAGLQVALRASSLPERTHAMAFAHLARWGMLTDRMLDVMLVGVAFQHGWIPLSVSSLEIAARRLEQRGWARTMEALALGRTLAEATGTDSSSRPTEASAEHLARRAENDLRRSGRHGCAEARRLAPLLVRTLEATARLDAEESQRTTRAAVVEAVVRAKLSSDQRHVERLVAALQLASHVDDGAGDAAFLAMCALPICEVFLPRDAIAVAILASSALHRRRLREVLDVRTAAGDSVERRFLLRAEFALGSGRWRAEFRTSGWSLRLLNALGRIIPFGSRWPSQSEEACSTLESMLGQAVAGRSARGEWLAWAAAFDALMRQRPAGAVSLSHPSPDALDALWPSRRSSDAPASPQDIVTAQG
ncbi:MAG: hypothetical protein O2855_02910 [Planctomycetota bacterium]|nr:hypothetical protein [Planctomycetota bacterium]